MTLKWTAYINAKIWYLVQLQAVPFVTVFLTASQPSPAKDFHLLQSLSSAMEYSTIIKASKKKHT